MEKKKILLGGGQLPDETYQFFVKRCNNTADFIQGLDNFQVINPAEYIKENTVAEESFDLIKDKLLKADYLFLLPNWKKDALAVIEYEYASAYNIEVVHYEYVAEMQWDS